jgi:DNA-binding MarR family transcriptional regulator
MAIRRREAADRLHSAAIHLLRALREADQASALSPARLSALSVLVFGGEQTLSELARAEGVTVPTMSRLAQSLEGQRFVERVPHPQDARASILRPTQRARTVLRAARERRLDIFERLLEKASGRELETLDSAGRILERLVRSDG